ncbi:CDP-glycerol glycerophosphotransferase family protein [Latilactobacillus sakei]|uniref:CDP-glycerol glycerophosphotransferase family protein n=1 Tax=Latilactobacillus sakei TaxID=1599 RepID=UPI000C1272A9|nr:CDP-glycerol glycerophosphotransferase family protein [Latilactobacillus sakei]SON71841.1 CDP-glycerol:poly(Glycerophosphate) glycerophosphotransferase [Latilactobacillus sakei]
MRNYFIYRVKHSFFIKNVYILIGSIILSFLNRIIKKDKELILFVSSTGKSFGGSPYDIYKYIESNDKYRNYRFVWAFEDVSEFPFKEDARHKNVKMDSLRYFYISMKARYWVTDVNIERSLRYKSKGNIYLNTWHGVALKKIGNDDKFSGRYDYSNIDYLCVSGEHDKDVYSSALNATSSSFLECGMPRNDQLFNATEEDNNRLRNKLGLPLDKKIMLYAPTWRDSVNNGVSYDIKIPINFKKWKEQLGNNWVVLFRAHDRTTKLLDLEFDDFIQDYSKYPQLNDLLIVSDLLITDYSSIIFDYSILKKPFLSFGYDYDTYHADRGFYVDVNDVFPYGVIDNETQLLELIKKFSFDELNEKLDLINSNYMNYSKGAATKICVEKLLGDEID